MEPESTGSPGPAEPTRSLVERAQGGEKAAFDGLVSRHRSRLAAIIRGRLGSHLQTALDPEDVFQETVLKALQSISRFSWQGEDSFLRWMAGIAEHIIQNAARRQERRPQVPLLSEVAGAEEQQWKTLRRDERFERFQRALDSLDPSSRKVIHLARLQGLPIKEVARQIGRSANATSILLYRALIKLKQAFGDTESLGLPGRSLEERGGDDAR